MSSPWIILCSSKPTLWQAIPEALPEESNGTSWKEGPRPANAKNQMSQQQYAPRPLPKEPRWQSDSTP
jgi:hypothetical protein